jgi:FixJ family two-component response regulator
VLRFGQVNAFATERNMSGDAKIFEKSIVCVVDDDFSVRDSTQRLIRSFGFRAKAFASAEEFENAGNLDEAACLILDVQMPGMSGIQLQRQLASRRREIPIIFITAYEDDVVRAQAIREGAVAFLIKPFSEEVLLDAIHTALSPPSPAAAGLRRDRSQ